MSTPEERKSAYLEVVEFFKSGRRPRTDAVNLSFPAMGVIEWALKEKAIFGLKDEHVQDLKDAIVPLKKASELDPSHAMTFYYLGMAHLTILETDSSIYDEVDTSRFVEFCKDGIAYFMDALHCDSPPFFTSQKLDEIVLLAEKKGIYLSVSWDKYKNKNEHEYVDVYENADERANMIELKKAEKLKNDKRMKELDKAEKLKKDAKTLLGLSGSLESRSERAKYIAGAISMLDQVLSINPKDNATEKEIDRAYDLLSKECRNHKVESSTPAVGKGEASLSKNETAKKKKKKQTNKQKIVHK